MSFLKSKGFLNVLRLIGIIIALGVGATSVLLFFFSPFSANPFTVISCIYLVFFCLLCICGELKLIFVIQWFKFMENFFGLGLFHIFIGVFIMRGTWWCYLVGAVDIGLGVIYVILHFAGVKRGIDSSDKGKKEQEDKAVKYATNAAADQAVKQNTPENRAALAENGGKANPFDNDNPFHGGGNAY